MCTILPIVVFFSGIYWSLNIYILPFAFRVRTSIFITVRQLALSRCFRSLIWDHGFPARCSWDITEKTVSLLHTPPPAHPSSFAPSIWNSHLPTITASTICDNGERFLVLSTLSECCNSHVSFTWGNTDSKTCPWSINLFIPTLPSDAFLEPLPLLGLSQAALKSPDCWVALGNLKTPLFTPNTLQFLRRDPTSHPVRHLSDAMDHWSAFTPSMNWLSVSWVDSHLPGNLKLAS